jgi:hypothetical protein
VRLLGDWYMGFWFYVKFIITLPIRILLITIPASLIRLFSKDKAIDYVLKNDWLDKWLFG